MRCNKSKPFRRSLVMDRSVRTSWKKKMDIKNERKAAKQLEAEIKAEKQKLIEEKRNRREENKRRREENARKAEVVQKITNSKKLKRLSKKQMKKVRKQS